MKSRRIWISRLLIGVVFVINVQCALLFTLVPEDYIYSFELSGPSGVAGMGVLFLMWNVPYAVALINPIKYQTSLYEAIVMQAIGLLGESFILWSLPGEHNIARLTITRFIIFDGGGLVALLLAALIVRKPQNRFKREGSHGKQKISGSHG